MKTLARVKKSRQLSGYIYWWGTVVKRDHHYKTGKPTVTLSFENRMWWRNYIPEQTYAEDALEFKTVRSWEDWAIMVLIVLTAFFFAWFIYLASK